MTGPQLVERAVGLSQGFELPRHAEARFGLGQGRVVDAAVARVVKQRPPRRQTGGRVVQVRLLHGGELRGEEGVARIPVTERLENRDREIGAPLVPEIDDLELIGRLPLEQAAAGAGALDPGESFGLVAAGQHQQEAQHFGAAGGDVGVVLVEAVAEICVVEVGVERDGAIERLLDAFAVARGTELLVAQHAPLHARRVGRPDVEMRLGAGRFARDPGLGRGDGVLDRRGEGGIERLAARIEEDAPPDGGGGEHVAGFARGRPGGGRGRAAGARQIGVGFVEAGIEDVVVDAGEGVHAAQLGGGGRRGARGRVDGPDERGGERRKRRRTPPARRGHVRLVRSCCFSACRSRASAISRSRRLG